MITQSNKGFTLLEMLVAIGIFAIIMTVASGIFSTTLQSQERMLTQQLAISNTSYSLEYMSRAIRMAKKDVEGHCLNTTGCNYTNPSGDNSIRFLNHDKKCVEFLLENGQIKRKKSNNKNDNFGDTQSFTSNDLNIRELKFELQGECHGDERQPTINISLDAATGEEMSFRTQTTAVQRNLDVPE